MNTYEIIKELVKQRFMTVAQLERTLDLSNGSISKWAKSKVLPNFQILMVSVKLQLKKLLHS
nr:MAG TPA: Regulatory protein [Caudoviricetes sp.]